VIKTVTAKPTIIFDPSKKKARYNEEISIIKAVIGIKNFARRFINFNTFFRLFYRI
jgi:hypothetical protein